MWVFTLFAIMILNFSTDLAMPCTTVVNLTRQCGHADRPVAQLCSNNKMAVLNPDTKMHPTQCSTQDDTTRWWCSTPTPRCTQCSVQSCCFLEKHDFFGICVIVYNIVCHCVQDYLASCLCAKVVAMTHIPLYQHTHAFPLSMKCLCLHNIVG